MATQQEIRATFLEECHRWDTTVIVLCRDEKGALLKIKTQSEEDELAPGLTYSFLGHWKKHIRWGLQFVAKTFIKVQPHDEAGVIAYLCQAPGIGRMTAQAIWKLYQGEAVRTLREQPEAVAEAIGSTKVRGYKLTAEKAKEAAAYLDQEKAVEDATIDLMALLSGRGFPRDTTKHAIRQWGNRAAHVVRQNPYQLMRFRGCGFAKTDELYLELGGDPAKMKRQALCIWYGISRDTTGSTWFDTGMVEKTLREKVGGAEVKPVRAAKLGIRAGVLDVYRNGGPPWITEFGRSKAEHIVAQEVARRMAHAPAWPGIEDLDVSDHQREQLAKALSAPIGIFSGNPGTGKSFSSARLIGKLVAEYGTGSVAVVAPTGKAAVRIRELLEAGGLEIRARTIHSYLGVGSAEDGVWSFTHNGQNPVEERFVIVDEASMCDVSIMAALTEALPEDGHLLLVGDLQQLPPVGHGAPLRDLLLAGIPNGDLREIRRNSGAIVETCARIRDQEDFELPEKLDLGQGKNLCLKYAPDGLASIEAIVGLIRKIRDGGEMNPVWDVQVIVAVNERSQVSRRDVNKILQAELNGRNRAASRFWPEDKIVCLKNSFLPPVKGFLDQEELTEDAEGWTREKESGEIEVYVANGELGRVIDEQPNKLILEFSAPKRVVLVPKGEEGGGLEHFDLGYAVSCHKSQGSQWPIVIVAIDDYPGARMVCDRAWIYTATSRAEKACIFVGQEGTLKSMCRRQAIQHRKTFLVERLAEARKIYEVQKEGPGSEEPGEERCEERSEASVS